MEHGICRWMVMAMRAQPSHPSEMVSQLLFGETYEVIEAHSDWLKISTTDCHYEGWVSVRQHTPISEEEHIQWVQREKRFVETPFCYFEEITTGTRFPVAMGSLYPVSDTKSFVMAGIPYRVCTDESLPIEVRAGLTPEQNRLIAFASQYLRAPYLWGGRTPAGIDCSGFTQMAFHSIGVQLPRDASQQVHHGKTVAFAGEAKVGDLAFFENREGRIVHVGIVCGPQQIIHACGYVQINLLDDTGIYHTELGRYTHSLRIIKRVLS